MKSAFRRLSHLLASRFKHLPSRHKQHDDRLELGWETLESKRMLASIQLVVEASPLELASNSDGYEDFAVFGGGLIAEGDVAVSVDLATSDIGGLYLVQSDGLRDIALYRDGQNWIVTSTNNGVYESLMTLTSDLSGVFSLAFTNDFGTLTVTSPGDTQQTHQFGSSFYTDGAALQTRLFIGPQATLTIDDLSVTQTDLSGYESAGSLEPSLNTAAATHEMMFGALPDTWEGTPQHQILFSQHTGLLTWAIGYPDDVADPVRSYQRIESQISYAVANGMRIRGHSLIWHLETPSELGNGSHTRETLIEVMRDRIQNTISAYPEVDEWVVVNEPLEYDGTLRESVWQTVIGDDYIELAFQFADEVADADDLLLINEYEVEIPGTPKSAAYLQMVTDLLNDGVAVDAVGIQAHVALGNAAIPTYGNLLDTFEGFGNLGTRVHVTELDVNTVFMSGTSAEKETQQAAIYADVANACINSGVCGSITTWGLSDPYSWLLDPVLVPSGGEAPLIFDGTFAPKQSFDALLSAFNNQAPNVEVLTETVSADMGELAIAHGTFSDPNGDELTLTASVGNIESNESGEWTWTFDTLAMEAPPQVTVSSTDPAGAVGTTTFDLVVLNVSPTITNLDSSHTDACESSADGAVTVSGTFSDPGTDTHNVTIDWGDGTAEDFIVSENDLSFELSHTYDSGGWFEVIAFVTDSNGATSDVVTTQAVVEGVGLVGDVLYIIGTSGDDLIYLSQNYERDIVRVIATLDQNSPTNVTQINKTFETSSVTQVISYLCDGNDTHWSRSNTFAPMTSQTVFGGGGNDVLRGSIGTDVLHGQAGQDLLTGLAGDDELDGGADDDRLFGGSGSDLLLGSDGNDVLNGGLEDDHLFGGSGNDRMYGSSGDDELIGENGQDNIYGGYGDDVLDGGNDDDRIFGNDDDDTLLGGEGNDFLSGGRQNDVLNGGVGNDRLSGWNGDDSLVGGSGDDKLYGGSGDDELLGQDGQDEIFGGSGDDLLNGGLGNDRLLGNNGSDVLLGGEGDDALYGGRDKDALSGGDGNDFLNGVAGDDILIGGADSDEVRGGDGYDLLIGDSTANDNSELSLRTAIASFSISTLNQTFVELGPITNDLYLDVLVGLNDNLTDGPASLIC